MIKRFGRIALPAFAVLLSSSLAQAQASRTWVSGVGDDANPCSRTAPCKTFAGAISKTAPFGEINAIDPGGFGAVTITKSITIDASPFIGGVLASLTTGVIVNGPGIVVTLRGLDLNGFNNGLNGINVVQAAAVHVENCTIYGFNSASANAGNGIATPLNVGTSQLKLFVKDSYIHSNADSGIGLKPAAGNSVTASINNTRLEQNQVGLRVEDNANATFVNGVAAGNSTNGVNAVSAAGPVNVSVTGSALVNNGNNGARVSGAQATVRLSQNTITRNQVGMNVASGNMVSFGNNFNAGNTTSEGAPTLTVQPQ